MTSSFYYGYQGSVSFHPTGGTAAGVTHVTAWSISISKDILSTTRINDTYEKSAGGIISGTGNVEVLYDGTNTDLITAINRTDDTGNAVFELYLDTAGNKRITFSGIINSAEYGANASTDGVQRINCTFVTNGTISLNL